MEIFYNSINIVVSCVQVVISVMREDLLPHVPDLVSIFLLSPSVFTSTDVTNTCMDKHILA